VILYIYELFTHNTITIELCHLATLLDVYLPTRVQGFPWCIEFLLADLFLEGILGISNGVLDMDSLSAALVLDVTGRVFYRVHGISSFVGNLSCDGFSLITSCVLEVTRLADDIVLG